MRPERVPGQAPIEQLEVVMATMMMVAMVAMMMVMMMAAMMNVMVMMLKAAMMLAYRISRRRWLSKRARGLRRAARRPEGASKAAPSWRKSASRRASVRAIDPLQPRQPSKRRWCTARPLK